MENKACSLCGGCPLRGLEKNIYQNKKISSFQDIIQKIKTTEPINFSTPIFVEDGQRRRADIEFCYIKKNLLFGFNERKTHNIVNIDHCPMLCSQLNEILPNLKSFLEAFCQITTTVKNKKKLETYSIKKGSIKLLKADNGIDILLELPSEPKLEHRLLIADFMNSIDEIIRVSWTDTKSLPETVAMKTPPLLYIKNYQIEIPTNVFLQASKTAETQMIETVLNYMGNTKGNIADLFCGLGTFTYPLAQDKENQILSIDSSSASLEGLKKALNQNQIHNVTVINKNLFKYPLDEAELKDIKALVIDPPRAGAHAECRCIAAAAQKPEKIVFVSCNPETFVYDAEVLINAGYKLADITLVDQFVYSNHMELVALFLLTEKYKKGV